jgi:hypothetical protein
MTVYIQPARRILRTGLFVACSILPRAGWCAEAVKPDVFIAATGGTIAGTQANVEQHGYTAGQLGVASLITAVPQLKDIATVTGEQVMNIPSQDMNDAAWLKLARRFCQRSRHGRCSIALGMGIGPPRGRRVADGMRRVRLNSRFGTERAYRSRLSPVPLARLRQAV